MDITIYNTLSGKKEVLKTLVPNLVKLYVCGVTVYDHCHLGHARSMLIFDMVVKYLRWLGYAVMYVRNITDVDDKIIQRAQDGGEECAILSQRFIDAMHADEKSLGVAPPDMEPRATAFIPEMIQMIERLIAKGFAYVADSGDVCYEIKKFTAYGKLSQRKPEELRAGPEVVRQAGKRDPLDFVLWKLSKPGEPYWSSPWGVGRPGWHIECSAMSTHCLGEHFDLHGGGLDLKFPHHENEIAQSEAVTEKPFANIWMHAGLLQVNGEKMSKSLGNFMTIQTVLAKHSVEVVRFFMLSAHYRSPLNYSEATLAQATSAVHTFYTALRDLNDHGETYHAGYIEQFKGAMQDDFNTPKAVAVLFELAREINISKNIDADYAEILAATLRYLAHSIGFLVTAPQVFFQGHLHNIAIIEALIAQREQARRSQNWLESDRIRDQLQALSIILEDGPHGTIWRRAAN